MEIRLVVSLHKVTFRILNNTLKLIATVSEILNNTLKLHWKPVENISPLKKHSELVNNYQIFSVQI